MSNMIYTSRLARYMQSFLYERLSLGYKSIDVKFTLKTIDDFLNEINFKGDYITKDVYELWLSSIMGQKLSTVYSKASIFIRFVKYMNRIGVECYIPRQPRKHNSGYVPYIYSIEEIANIFKACDLLRARERHAKSIMIAIPALIRLLYSTAIRLSEALMLKIGDIDFGHHVLTLSYTKNGSQRLAPINPSMETVLKQYLYYRSKMPVKGLESADSSLFVSSLGKPCARKTVLKYFHNLVRVAGIPYRGNYEGPHVHCIRHTACVHSLLKTTKSGMDIYCSLPILSTFMGHKKVLNTERYLRMTQEMYPDIIKMDATVTASINGVIKRSLLISDNG